MEQHQEQDAEPSTKYSKMNKKQFEELITVSKHGRYELIFFILNALNHILNGDSWCCYCDKMKIENDGIVSTPRWRSGCCQICKILSKFPDSERDIDKNRFNMPVLIRYYDQLFKELVQLFEEWPEAVEFFNGVEYVYSGRDWYSGEYWRVPLSESIRYADGIILAQQRDKQKKKRN